jgi:hypothetical protein
MTGTGEDRYVPYQEARERVTFGSFNEWARALADLGGQPEFYERMATLGAHTAAIGAGMIAWADEHPAKYATRALIRTGEQFTAHSQTPVLLQGWLVVWASDLDPDRAEVMDNDLRRMQWTTKISDWPMEALGEIGPYAYAAGLSGEEARAAHAAGTLDAGRLRLLAGLRGYRLP